MPRGGSGLFCLWAGTEVCGEINTRQKNHLLCESRASCFPASKLSALNCSTLGFQGAKEHGVQRGLLSRATWHVEQAGAFCLGASLQAGCARVENQGKIPTFLALHCPSSALMFTDTWPILGLLPPCPRPEQPSSSAIIIGLGVIQTHISCGDYIPLSVTSTAVQGEEDDKGYQGRSTLSVYLPFLIKVGGRADQRH